MRLPALLMIFVFITNLFVDWYIWVCFKLRTRSNFLPKFQLFFSILLYLLFFVIIFIPKKGVSDNQLIAVMWMLFGYFTFYIPKYFFVIFDFTASLPKIWRHKRMKWLTATGVAASILIFGSLWWGALITRQRTQIIEETIWIPDLPKSFDGFKIVQFSDFHVGTFGNDTTFVDKVVFDINEINPDIICFTGDIVNRRSEELSPFTKALSRLKSKYGVYSVLGNHDYGDYCDWPSVKDKEDNMKLLYSLQEKMGWRLLRNEHIWLKNKKDSIALIGVENIGDPPFPTYGSLSRSYKNLADSTVKILLSHNPAHWTNEIESNDSINIALTLAGHTHAMQMEVAGLSPAYFRYPKWGGLYKTPNGRKNLYVNIGLGTVGIPMRLGATPEITIITLKSGNQPASD